MVKKTDMWMPIYIGDYLADTGHLTTTQHGAYLLLLMHYWRKRELPDDDKQLAAIAKLPLRIWLDTKETIQAFFHDGWKHKRIEEEIQRRSVVSEKRAAAGSNGGKRKREAVEVVAIATDLLKQTGSMTQSHTQKEDSEANASGAEAPLDPSEPERQFFARGKEILGRSAGGQLVKLKTVCGGNISLARSKIELAATKHNAAEFIAGVIRSGPQSPTAKPLTAHQRERQTSREILSELDQFISGSGGQADFGLLRHDTGDRPARLHSGIGGDVIDLSPVRSREGG